MTVEKNIHQCKNNRLIKNSHKNDHNLHLSTLDHAIEEHSDESKLKQLEEAIYKNLDAASVMLKSKIMDQITQIERELNVIKSVGKNKFPHCTKVSEDLIKLSEIEDEKTMKT